jgi:hypothetical protein
LEAPECWIRSSASNCPVFVERGNSPQCDYITRVDALRHSLREAGKASAAST